MWPALFIQKKNQRSSTINAHEGGCLQEHDASPRQSTEAKKNLHSQAINHYVATFQDVSVGTSPGLEATNVLGVFIPSSVTIVWGPSSSQTFTAAKKALWLCK